MTWRICISTTVCRENQCEYVVMFVECDFEFAGTFGEFTSPGYPSSYANSLNLCVAHISAAPGSVIRITFHIFAIEDGGQTCGFDYVKVRRFVLRIFFVDMSDFICRSQLVSFKLKAIGNPVAMHNLTSTRKWRKIGWMLPHRRDGQSSLRGLELFFAVCHYALVMLL